MALKAEIDDALGYVHSLHGSTRQAGRAFASVNSKAHSKKGERMLDMDYGFPDTMRAYYQSVHDRTRKLNAKLDTLRVSFKNMHMESIIGVFMSLELSLVEVEDFMTSTETIIHVQLKNCHVAFDIDPHLVEKFSDRKLSQAAVDRMSMSPHARRKDHNAFNAGQFTYLYIGMAVMFLITLGTVVLNIHSKMTKQVKKRM
jgi:hypothetical protein